MLARFICRYHSRAYSVANRASPGGHVRFLFPGQGSQYVGMCKQLLHFRGVTELFEIARRVLGFDLLDVCLNGPAELLNRTDICQPAVVVASLAALESLKSSQPEIFSGRPLSEYGQTAGFSVGELTALVFAEAMTAEEGLKLVHARAKAMREASEGRPSGLVTVVGLTEDGIWELCKEAKEYSMTSGIKNPVAVISNYLFPRGFVIGGDLSAVQYVVEVGKRKHGAKRVQRLPVSGAFHTSLMSSALPVFQEALSNAHISTPTMPVYSNVTGKTYSSTSEIRSLLVKQLVEPILWPRLILNMFDGRTLGQAFELGPNKQLRAMIQRIDPSLVQQFTNIAA